MESLVNACLKLILLSAWIAGFVIAKGFWSTVFCVLPFWSYYLVIEKFLIYFAVI